MIHPHLDTHLPPPPDRPVKQGGVGLYLKFIYSAILMFFIFFIFGLNRISSFSDSEIFQKLLYLAVDKGIFFYSLFPFFIYFFIKYLKYTRIISDLPTSKIRSASMGMVELKGIARRKYNLLSPVAKLPCVYYRVKKYKRSGSAEEGGWSWYETETSGAVPFYLEDDTGRVSVYPTGADFFPLKKEVHINTGGIYASGIAYCVPVNQKWEEEIILEGSPLYTLGWAEYPLQTERSSIKRIRLDILRRIKSDRDLFMKYDADKNGEIDQYEWEKAVTDADRAAYQEYLKSGDSKKELFLLLDPPFRGFPMIIAPTKIEEKILKRYSIYTIFNIIAAVSSFVAGSIMMFSN